MGVLKVMGLNTCTTIRFGMKKMGITPIFMQLKTLNIHTYEKIDLGEAYEAMIIVVEI